MTRLAILQPLLFVVVLLLLAKPLGRYIANIFEGQVPRLVRWLRPFENGIYRICGVRPDAESDWKEYSFHLLLFHILGFALLYGLQRLQGLLPLNPARMPAVSPDLSFNTAASYITATNWQSYGGEFTLSYLTQMVGLTVQNFLAAAAGMAVLMALVRGIVRRQAASIGNFWVDMTRSVLYLLMPLSIVFALVLVSQGIVQTLGPYVGAPLLQSAGNQMIALGPAASQIAIKQIGANGGGYFNVNSAHPFENPTALSNFLQCLAILLIPAAQCYAFGRMVRDVRQGWALLAAMTLVMVVAIALCTHWEFQAHPKWAEIGVTTSAGNLEGKEQRFGVVHSTLMAVAGTCSSAGPVNSMHDSYAPLSGLVSLVLMQVGEVIFGGVGCGLYSMLIYVLITVFIAGLMIGRMPEYLGKKIEAFEMKMASIAAIIPCACALLGTAIAVQTPDILKSISNPLPHGFSQVLYAFSSAANNNGSPFAGFNANTPTINLLLGLAMLISRFGIMIAVLALAGSLAAKKSIPASEGRLSTHSPLFVLLLLSVVLVMGALSYLPSLALGPIAEHVQLLTTR